MVSAPMCDVRGVSSTHPTQSLHVVSRIVSAPHFFFSIIAINKQQPQQKTKPATDENNAKTTTQEEPYYCRD
jgi:hypothetical protein